MGILLILVKPVDRKRKTRHSIVRHESIQVISVQLRASQYNKESNISGRKKSKNVIKQENQN